MRKLTVTPVAALLLLLAVPPLFAEHNTHYYDPRVYSRARVEKIERQRLEGGNLGVEIKVHLRILEGRSKGQRHVSVYRGEEEFPKDMFYREGDTVFIGISALGSADDISSVSIYDVDNTFGIILMVVLLAITITAVGRLKGVLSMVSLVLTVFLIFYILVPMTLNGRSPLPIAVAIAFVAILITVPIIMGFHKKTLAAILGASSGVVMATLLALFSGWLLHLSGLVTNEMLTVFYASTVEVDVRSLALAGIVIAALGAIIDVCISIASATEEIFRAHPEIPVRQAFTSVMTVSRDMLGATVNTLLFAYVGSALPLVLMISMRFDPDMPIWMVFSYNPVLSELIKSCVGCMGMFLSMPATALICIELHMRGRKRAGAAQNS
ncbi:MAG: YibE/F family protein [Spirochaetes bacterium]|nr:YibE/F family protein [Spirochaetota bacterium]